MGNIPFTQYLRPQGRPTQVSIDRPSPISERAVEIVRAGFRFECEELATGHVSFTISDDDGDYACAVCENGAAVPPAVDQMIKNFNIQKGLEERSRKSQTGG